MTPEEYADTLQGILTRAATATGVAGHLEQLLAAARAQEGGADAILVDVFVDQDAEGPFDVWARFEGRDAFALDRRFERERNLFGVEWTEDGWDPDVPARPRGWSREDLEAAVVSAVSAWIAALKPAASPEDFWLVGTPDGGFG
ncbi:DUF6389 family protein [Leucobacter chromiireducens]|uniref:Immunity protein Imm1 n=1 Tax=Leucobacter chromiireducens subsp. solipictus TaxID=398235 RepID=A0ABS1SJG0_9MICO|nr:DUF6389 family protein [Leucobacter chromiireducens]MBL3680511.1 hypothetical protein [Leucobacter chromiireducens subsp. solipictus]